MKSYMASPATIEREWYVVDATGHTLGRLASEIAKKYILKEGVFVPFLYDLKVMTKEGAVIKQKYDKFRQINRYLEMVDKEVVRG